MFDLPLHPVLVHVPIALSVLIPVITLVLLGLFWKQGLPRRSWALVPLLAGMLLGSGLVAAETGEDDEEKVERVVPEAAIEAHEEAAELFNVGAGALFVIALVGLGLKSEKWRRVAGAGTALVSFAVLGLGVNVGHAGGKLVYQHGAASVHVSDASGGAPATSAEPEYERDDD